MLHRLLSRRRHPSLQNPSPVLYALNHSWLLEMSDRALFSQSLDDFTSFDQALMALMLSFFEVAFAPSILSTTTTAQTTPLSSPFLQSLNDSIPPFLDLFQSHLA